MHSCEYRHCRIPRDLLSNPFKCNPNFLEIWGNLFRDLSSSCSEFASPIFTLVGTQTLWNCFSADGSPGDPGHPDDKLKKKKSLYLEGSLVDWSSYKGEILRSHCSILVVKLHPVMIATSARNLCVYVVVYAHDVLLPVSDCKICQNTPNKYTTCIIDQSENSHWWIILLPFWTACRCDLC